MGALMVALVLAHTGLRHPARALPLGTSVAEVQRIQRFVINGADILTSGLDYRMNYRFDGVAQGSLDIGLGRHLSVGIRL